MIVIGIEGAWKLASLVNQRNIAMLCHMQKVTANY